MIKFLIKPTTTTSKILKSTTNIFSLNFNNKRNYSCCSSDNHNHIHNHNHNNNENNNENKIRVRYAPSPTGYLHLGGLRTALFNYLFAKKNNGTFILRIEDTDRTRFVEGSAKSLAGCLEWAGIPYDEGPSRPGECGPYVQSERLPIYKEYAEKLVKSGHAYHCFCSSERLSMSRINLKNQHAMSLYDRHCLKLSEDEIQRKLQSGESHTIRLKIPPGITKFTDHVKGTVQFNNQLIDDQVLMKSDGYPTYHLASVVDDHLMGISHIIRGEEWLNSTPKHIILYQAFGWKPPQMVHVPLLLNSDKSKLSKRQGDVSVDSYISKGYLPEALINFVSFLGWSPSTSTTSSTTTTTTTTTDQETSSKEIFTLKELVESFSLDGINKSGSVVNMERLDWLNVNHIRLQIDDPLKQNEILLKIKNQLLEYFNNNNNIDFKKEIDTEYLLKSINCVKERVHLIEDFNNLLKPFFIDQIDYTTEEAIKMKQKVWKGDDSIRNIEFVIKRLQDLQDFTMANVYKQLQLTCSQDIYKDQQLTEKELTTKTNQLMSNLRYILLGSPVGGGIPLAIETFGKDKTIKTLLNGLNLNK
ncbi:glutamate-tRNA ligase [Dictyostelium discoideum AX4]|uniref:glutamate--tRNA ligase n=1 Tax=Dictyostelium discoideum TaxID=44689 RepID=Q869Z3_DICDI|nr:glutamate-tRNA ligase [Dictyostelium discoideum AX4]EAL71477.1 glutamate-tRNA ligase [Dictyostelium discoideum AX4]|eukprot:XP_645395.1 glutamate-tRNA ligase [Dictyostelium discoideum AX4]